jgi:endonuclease YncB( thermonuclease family)
VTGGLRLGLLAAGLLAPGAVLANGPQPVPEVVVIDGDSIELDGTRIDFWGIDAPELGQLCGRGSGRYRCGQEAAATLNALIARHPVTCRPTPLDTADQGEICAIGAYQDLAEAMLRKGYAVTRPGALAVYRRAEHEAQMSRLGIWRGAFVPPAAWRAGARIPGEQGEAVAVCSIKGLVGPRGERVYLVPSDPVYSDRDVDPGRGEHHFCSDDEAEAAGWRRFPRKKLAIRPAD